MPDALSKTVPIWCAVINRLVFPEEVAAGKLHAPAQVIGRSEQALIEARLRNFVRDVEVCDYPILPLGIVS